MLEEKCFTKHARKDSGMKANSEKKWKSQFPACGWYISYLYRKSSSQMFTVLKDIGLSINQSIVLVGVYRNPGSNQVSLANEIAMTPGVMSRVLRELEDAGYIEKRRDEDNRRNYLLYLTEQGSKAASESLNRQADYWMKIMRTFTPEEMQELNHLLERMEKNIDDEPAAESAGSFQ
jgi:DNA-binding MarR family transcriptional regulator